MQFLQPALSWRFSVNWFYFIEYSTKVCIRIVAVCTRYFHSRALFFNRLAHLRAEGAHSLPLFSRASARCLFLCGFHKIQCRKEAKSRTETIDFIAIKI